MSVYDEWKKKKEKKEEEEQTSVYEQWKKDRGIEKSFIETELTKSNSVDKSGLFKASEAYNNNEGNWFTDTAATVGSTIGDIGTGLVKGIFGLGEGIGDLISYGIADIQEGIFNDKEAAERRRMNTKESATDYIFNPVQEALDKNSVIGDTGDNITQGLGYVAGMTALSIVSGGTATALGASASGATTAATIASTATTFSSSMGNGMSEALNDGASIDEARLYGAISGVAEAGSELMFGGLGKASKAIGLSKGAGELDSKLASSLTKNIKNKMVKTLIQSGVKATGEGLEEVTSGLVSALGKKITYQKDKDLDKILEDENLSEQFWMGVATSAIAQGPSTLKSIKNGTDYITGRTQNEDKIFNNEIQTRTEEKVKEATIEQAYNNEIQAKENLGIEITEQVKEETRQKVEQAYNEGRLKNVELSKKEIAKIEDEAANNLYEGNISTDTIRNVLGENADLSKDSYLQRSIYENSQKSEDFKFDKTDNEKSNITMQSALDAGMNNTSKAHKKVDTILKLQQDTGRQYIFVNQEQLKQKGYNENANGLIDKETGAILLNLSSNKDVQTTVGHEVTHIFDVKNENGEYNQEYKNLQDIAIEYLKSKGTYNTKIDQIMNAYGYNVIENEAQIKEELTADVVGDYLFNDTEFINKLSTNKNVFQKIYNYIKEAYTRLKGTDEEKKFLELKNKFEEVYKTIDKVNTSTETGVKYSIKSDENGKYVNIDVDQELFDGLNHKEKRQMAKMVIMERYSQNGIELEKDNINVNNKTATKYTSTKQAGNKTTKESKYKLSTELDNLLKVSEKINNLPIPDTKGHSFAKDGWDYYYSRFKVGNIEYIGKIDIGLNNGNKTLYDVTDIKTVNEYKKMIANGKLDESSTICLQSLLNNSIAPSNTDVNTNNNDMQKNVKYSLSDNQNERLSKLNENFDLTVETRDQLYDQRDELQKQYDELTQSQEYKDAYKRLVKITDMSKIESSEEYAYVLKSQNLKNKINDIQDEIDIATSEIRRLSESIDKEEKQHRNPEESIKQAKKELGLTNNFKEAGYMLQDGSLLDFSGRSQGSNAYNQRTMDHREINQFGYDMNEFIDLGNIRMQPESNGFELMKEPTEQQYKKLKEYIDKANGEVYIDIYKNGHMGTYDTADYKPGTSSSKIINDLQYYFRNGKFPTKSQYADFMYSLTQNNTTDENADIRKTIEDKVGKNVKQAIDITENIEKPTIENLLNQTPEEKQQGMKDKAKKYLSRSKTKFINKIVNDFGTSKIANTNTLNNVVDSIREDIQNNGTLSKEKTDMYFNELYNNLVKLDTDYYDTYKDVKNEIRQTKLYIPENVKSDIADYNSFRKNNMGTLIMTSDSNNMSIDTYYQELNTMYPELFPDDIVNQADQLQRISDVAKDITKVETNVAAYNDANLGKDYRNWARAEFDKNINNFVQDIKLADRYNNDTNNKMSYEFNKEEIKNIYSQLPTARRIYEKALAKEVLTEQDKIQVKRLLDGEISPDEITSPNKKGILNVATAESNYDALQKSIKEYQNNIKNRRLEEAAEDIGDLSLWKDKKIGFFYSRETPIRNIYDIAPKNIADKIVNKYFRPYIETNEKKVTDTINNYNDRIKKLNIGTKNKYEITYDNVTKKVSESSLIQLLGENKITEQQVIDSGANASKITNAVKEFRNIYNELIGQINESMLDNGYAPIEYRKDYFPHFTEETSDTLLGKAAKLLGIDVTNREELPTDIAGQTYKFKPGRTWFSNMLQRTTDVTDYDALKGFDKYVRGATDLIYHTEDIQRQRALATAIRNNYNPTEIQNKIEEINEMNMPELDRAIAIQEIYKNAEDRSHLSKFIEWLDNYTNLLAGKHALEDRSAEKNLNRQSFKTITDIESRIAANAIGGNIGVSLTNFAPIAQAWGEVKTHNLINGIWQTMKSSIKGDTSFASESQFITRRRGADTLVETTLDKVTKPLNSVLEFADKFTSEVLVRSRYNQNLQEGMTKENALQEADRYVSGLMADRGRGALPTQFSNKNPIAKMINMFHVEVNNQWSYYFKDLPKNVQEKANGNKTKIVKDLALGYTKIMVGSYLINELLVSIRGNSTRVLPDPIYIIKELIKGLTDDDDDNNDDAIIETITEIAGNVPFISLPATLFADSLGLDVGDIGRVPVSGMIPNVVDITKDIFNQDMTTEEKIKSVGEELLDTVGSSLVLPYGGSQIKKTVKGLSLYSNDLPGSYTDSGDLRYTVEDDVGSKIQAGIFGAYANPYAQDYIDSGFKTIKKDNIDEMVGLDMNSTEYRQFKQGLNSNSKIEDKLNYINEQDLTDKQKTLVANNMNKNSKTTIDMSEYDNYNSYDEYKYARDYPEKYSVISQITDYDSFIQYKSDITNIKNQYTNTNDRKQAVESYIESLDLSVPQKMMLEKVAGGYSIKDYKNYMYQYLESLPMTSNEKYNIWNELFE